MKKDCILIDIPLAPPSVNGAYRHYRGRVVLSKSVRAFHDIAAKILEGVKVPKSWLYCNVEITITPPRRRCDIDNRVKVLLDTLTRSGVWDDDEKAATLRVSFTAPVKGDKEGRTLVRLTENEEKYMENRYNFGTGGWLDYAEDHGLPSELPDVPDDIQDPDADPDASWQDYDTLEDAE